MKLLAVLVLCIATPAVAAPLRAVRMDLFGRVCAVASDGAILCEKDLDLPAIDIKARDLVRAYKPLVVREDGSIVEVDTDATAFDKPKAVVLPTPFKVKSAGVIGSAKNDQLCVYGEKGELACRSEDDPKATYTTMPGRFVDVTFAQDIVWALDDRGALWCAGAYDCARLYAAAKKAPKASLLELARTYPNALDEPSDAPFWRITDGVKRYWATGSPCIERTADPKTLVCWAFGEPPGAYPRPKADELASIGLMLCARTGDSITCTMYGNEFHKPFTVSVKGAAKMHYGDRSFCVETKTGELQCAKLGNPLPPFEKVTWAARKNFAESR